ncbi:hypothetical protein YA21_17585 [Klebsiella aerogenes]|uniref:Uncharacterized protein n=1 Tax=Klebsiella aerogenes (strain ATCC 13048 / DSM 30053 / CCUG 1429 / JCM 1235 / KCTC 2190 / NBRC 13534 / NCIMB 10102 / NCTC 10006 / CDC 819-56) TaxID=1028307 RepID=A0A0H3G419_KLEAK|nr:hypothetical protein EAE_24780 [Klebsiella aerogenes KCTC 2190]KJM48861.1 hypothetical protein SS20_03810 [Klebsiella aerogenes]KLE44961.1 hypothetical protein YA13_15180 [Klebsiella aerogenes]KLE79107.1 hypothetical protein YA21_17585 [Klebsiella aerogenes]KLF48914.1 hypothetical protein YA33_01240 [Klebsiella aerogenes]
MEAREHSTASLPETLPVLKIQNTLTGTLKYYQGSEFCFTCTEEAKISNEREAGIFNGLFLMLLPVSSHF